MNLKGKSFLKLLDFTPEEIADLLALSAELKAKKKAGIPHKICDGKNVALIFEKTSTRTRCSFEVAARDLGMEGGQPALGERPEPAVRIGGQAERENVDTQLARGGYPVDILSAGAGAGEKAFGDRAFGDVSHGSAPRLRAPRSPARRSGRGRAPRRRWAA